MLCHRSGGSQFSTSEPSVGRKTHTAGKRQIDVVHSTVSTVRFDPAIITSDTAPHALRAVCGGLEEQPLTEYLSLSGAQLREPGRAQRESRRSPREAHGHTLMTDGHGRTRRPNARRSGLKGRARCYPAPYCRSNHSTLAKSSPLAFFPTAMTWRVFPSLDTVPRETDLTSPLSFHVIS